MMAAIIPECPPAEWAGWDGAPVCPVCREELIKKDAPTDRRGQGVSLFECPRCSFHGLVDQKGKALWTPKDKD